MALKLKGSTSGFVGLDAPSVAGNNTLISDIIHLQDLMYMDYKLLLL